MTTSAESSAWMADEARLSRPQSFFEDTADFLRFLWEELKPFPGRGRATMQLVLAAFFVTILAQTLRVPNAPFSVFIVFFFVSDQGLTSFKMGLLGMLAVTLAVALACTITICFMDAPWFRLPILGAVMAATAWLTLTLTPPIFGRFMMITLGLYFPLADFPDDAESLTKNTLWEFSVVGLPTLIAVITSLLFEAEPEAAFRARVEGSLSDLHEALLHSVRGRFTALEARSLRRKAYAHPVQMRQFLARWQKTVHFSEAAKIDWDIAVADFERFWAVVAGLASKSLTNLSPELRRFALAAAASIRHIRDAIQNHDPVHVRSIPIPAVDHIPAGPDRILASELCAALTNAPSVLKPRSQKNEEISASPSSSPLQFLPDAFTNPVYVRFGLQVSLAVLLSDFLINAVDWPGIRTCIMTCIVTAMATSGARHQRQLLRFAGVFIGGLLGLLAVLYVVPHLDTIVGLLVVMAIGTALGGWVGTGSPRIAYAGQQLALAFYFVLIPDFQTSIDLTGIRDRFVGVLIGVTAMWLVFDIFWRAASNQQVLQNLISILNLMARSPSADTLQSSTAPDQEIAAFRRQLNAALESGRQMFDEARIELAFPIEDRASAGSAVEWLAGQISLAGLLLQAVNERKLSIIKSTNRARELEWLRREDESLSAKFTGLANTLSGSAESSGQPSAQVAADAYSRDEDGLMALYRSIDECLQNIIRQRQVIRALP